MNFRTDNPAPAIRKLLAEVPLGPDPAFRGELARLKENRSFRMHYRRNGVTLDAFGELLFDRGIVWERPTPDQILCYFDQLFRTTGRGRKLGRKPVSARSIDEQVHHARTVRSRLYECRCGQKIHGTRQTAVVCGRCLPSAFETIASELATSTGLGSRIIDAIMATVREIIAPMDRKDPLPEEILAQSYATMEGAA